MSVSVLAKVSGFFLLLTFASTPTSLACIDDVAAFWTGGWDDFALHFGATHRFHIEAHAREATGDDHVLPFDIEGATALLRGFVPVSSVG